MYLYLNGSNKKYLTSFPIYFHVRKTNTFEIAIDPPGSNKYLLTFRGIECGVEKRCNTYYVYMENGRIFKIDSRP